MTVYNELLVVISLQNCIFGLLATTLDEEYYNAAKL